MVWLRQPREAQICTRDETSCGKEGPVIRGARADEPERDGHDHKCEISRLVGSAEEDGHGMKYRLNGFGHRVQSSMEICERYGIGPFSCLSLLDT